MFEHKLKSLNLVAGRIVHFRSEPEKCWGFILLEDGKTSVFFHQTRQKHVTSEADEPTIEDYWTTKPVVGEKVYCELEKAEKGLRAKYWIKTQFWEAASKKISERKLIRMYFRKGRIALSRLQPKPEIVKEWEGLNLKELRMKWKKEFYPAMNDEFQGRYFHQLQEDGTWQEIEDPR